MAILTKTQKYAAETYARYFGKTADAATLADYVSIGKTSKILKQIIEDADIEQYNVHGNDLQAEVHNEFQNLFSRNATNKELEKYVKVLQKGKDLPINSIVKKASKFDKDVYNNKQEIAKFVAENGGGVFDLSKVTKANPIDVKSLTSLADLQAKIDALPENDFVPTVFDGQSYNLTDGLDNLPGTNKNDIFTGSNSGTDKLNTANGVDILDGKAGIDTLKISTDGTAIEIPNITNIEIIEVTSTKDVTVDTAPTTGVTDLKVVKASDDVAATAGSETNITVSGVTSGDIKTIGGKDVTVTDTASTDANVSAITVGDALNGTATGDVKVTQNLNSANDAADITAAAINVTGGKTVTVTTNATTTAKSETSDNDITVSAVTVTADDKTTDVTVVNNVVETTFTKPAVELVGASQTVTFKDLASGATLTVNGLSFTAAKDLTAEQVAAAFANLAADDTQSSTGITANGFYTNAFDTSDWTSGAANGATVTFTGATFNETAMVISDATLVTTKTNGTAAAPKVDSTNGVTLNAVVIDDNAIKSIENITVDGATTVTLGKTGVTSGLNAIKTVSLKNVTTSVELDSTATSLDLTLNKVAGTVDLDVSGAGTITDLTIKTTGEKSTITALTAAAVTSLTVAAAADLDISTTPLTALVTANITGTGAVALGDVSGTLVTLSASAAKGAISATVDGDKATVTTGSGNDVITVDTASVTKEISLGAGEDRLDLSALTAANAGTIAAISGGADTDTVVLDGDEADETAGLSSVANSAIFKDKVTGFERLEISAAAIAAPIAVNVGNLGYNYVIVGAIGNTLDLKGMANNGTLELTGTLNDDLTVTMKDATGTADKFNIVANGAGVSAAESVVVANVETINIDAKSNSVINLTADAAKTINVTGEYDLDLDVVTATSHANLKTVDASTLEGDLTFTIDSLAANFVLTSGKGDDDITVSTSNNAQVKTGLGADTITVEFGAVSANIWGGAGNDIFDVTSAISSSTQYVTIEDATSGDQIILNTDNFLSGDITITDFDQMTLTDKFKAVLEDTTLNTGSDFAISFQHANNTYIVVSDGNGSVNFDPNNDFSGAATDQVIKLTGLKDLSAGASFNDNGTLEIA